MIASVMQMNWSEGQLFDGEELDTLSLKLWGGQTGRIMTRVDAAPRHELWS